MKKKTDKIRRFLACTLCVIMVLTVAGCGSETKTALDPENPATVTVWNYYNGKQLEAFESLVDEFNGSVGREKGIVVLSVSQGDINTLADSLIASVNSEAGAQEIPALAAVYSETAFILNNLNALVDMDKYFTEDELSAYIPGFIDEGRFNMENQLMLFPILKSTEIFTANETDWEPFAEATGITLNSIATKEDLTAAAEKYYKWTDELTPDVREDGKALYGRDSVANYVYVGAYQLGHEIFKVEDGKLTVDMDRDTFKTLWDNFYIPYINGYFGAYAKFRSEDCKTGKILALTSSSSSVSYLPTAVTSQDDTVHDITTFESKALPFENAANDAIVQQGASYCLLKGTEAQQEGAVEFLKWFTESERNVYFALMSGYSPVTKASNTPEAIKAAFSGDVSTASGQNILNALLISSDSFENDKAYATKPFEGSKDTRNILGDSLEYKAADDRKAVIEAIKNGASREEAVAKYVTEEYFDEWFDDLCMQINNAVGK